jgi:hypothetical protein
MTIILRIIEAAGAMLAGLYLAMNIWRMLQIWIGRKRLHRRLLLCLCICAFTSASQAATYYNSSESQCDGSDSSVVMCDDFEDGTWYVTQDATASAPNDGWNGTIFNSPESPCPSTCTIVPAGAAVCGAKGVAGTDCAATTGVIPSGYWNNEYGNMADHSFAPADSSYDELYARWYMRPSSDVQWGINTKFFTVNCGVAGVGGICLGSMGTHFHDGGLDMCPVEDCSVRGYSNPQGTLSRQPYLHQNQGNFINVGIDFPGEWYYIEVHVKLNTITGGVADQNGVWELWVDHCGTNGLSCTGSGTLRSQYTNVRWRGDADSAKHIRSLWQEINHSDSNPALLPTERQINTFIYYDQLVWATRRVGPMSIPYQPGIVATSIAVGKLVRFFRLCPFSIKRHSSIVVPLLALSGRHCRRHL